MKKIEAYETLESLVAMKCFLNGYWHIRCFVLLSTIDPPEAKLIPAVCICLSIFLNYVCSSDAKWHPAAKTILLTK